MGEAISRAKHTWLASHTARIGRTATAMRVSLATLSMVSTQAIANVTISPIASVISADQPQVSVIRVTSQSPQTQYVDVSVRRIVDPASESEQEVPVSLVDGAGLVASPAKFVLAGGTTRLVRVVSLGRPDIETAYRVYFRPVASRGDVDQDGGAGGNSGDSGDSSSIEPDVHVSFVWGALVRVAPANASVGLARSDDNLHVKNTGNVRVHVREMGVCAAGAQNTCDWRQVGRSVYPGQSQRIPDGLGTASVRVKYLVDGESQPQVKDLPLSQ